ncbi:MAG: sulfide/dihydroorotate dehydrogenase-like FAD/NAD-binding protein [Bacteroidetes bacterium]|nr:sulfide/dihydroorotate dehydrogenase-like FAD/NAD-binding protein [Bacteroidota bacterium]
MYKILTKKNIAPETFYMEIEAPKVAKSAKPGHFIMVKADEQAERIPLTVCDVDTKKGSVTIIFKAVGASTELLAGFDEGDSYLDFAGPLGNETELLSEDLEDLKTKKIMFIAGGIGAAPVHPQIKWLYENGIKPDVILGARSKDNLILLSEIEKMADNFYTVTDDGSYGRKALVTEVLEDLIVKEKKHYDLVITIGPLLMMKFVCLVTKKHDVKTIVSLNTLMVCGMGMCGACRATINNETKFTCVDGPEFDGHQVDFDEILNRQSIYKDEEKEKLYQFAHSEQEFKNRRK